VAHCLETRALVLRPFTLGDSRKIYELSREDGLKKWIPNQVYRDEAHARSVLDVLISQWGRTMLLQGLVQPVAVFAFPPQRPMHVLRES
jgi:hypothetical protein